MRNRSRRPLIDLLEARICLATFTVTSAADAGAGTLRSAIEDANRDPGADVIAFAIPGAGPHVISPLTQLPTITETLTIDGTTQSGYTSAAKKIVLDGDSSDPQSIVSGLVVSTTATLIKGLAIGRFSGHGIHISGGSGNTIEDCFIGLDANGDQARGNALAGVFIEGSYQNDIGGHSTGNVISANQGSGILIAPDGESVQSFDNSVLGNRIGTDRTGTLARGNAVAGITVTESPNTAIGGSPGTAGNVISGNPIGIVIEGYASAGAGIAGNRIGLQAGTNGALGNTSSGISLIGTTQVFVQANTIAHNAIGITVTSYDGEDNANAFSRNSIYSNTLLGIDLGGDGATANDDDLFDTDGGPNTLINFPVITSAAYEDGILNLTGTLIAQPGDTDMTLEFFFTDPAGQIMRAQGKQFIDSLVVTVDENGEANWQTSIELGSVPEGAVLTATTTSEDGATSEFSDPAEIDVQSLPPLELTTLDITGTEDVAYTWNLGQLIDPGDATTIGDFDIEIDWGDDSTSAGSAVAGEVGFTIRGSHTYNSDGEYTVTITITHDDGREVTQTLGALIEQAQGLIDFGRRLTVEAGNAIENQLIAFFVDPGGASGHEYQALIDWGDGTSPSPGVIRVLGATIRVHGSHTYASHLRGWQDVTVTLTDLSDSSTTEAQSRIRLIAPEQPLPTVDLSPVNVVGVEGISTGRVTVARFSLPGASLGDLRASLDFGDGSTGTGKIRQLSSGAFIVSAEHTFGHAGVFDIRTVLRVDGQRRGRSISLARIVNAPLLVSMPGLSFTAGEAFSGVVLKMRDSNPLSDAGDFLARIAWGDGSTSRGAVREVSPGIFRVGASHAYESPGSRLIQITLDDLTDNASPLVFQQRVIIQ